VLSTDTLLHDRSFSGPLRLPAECFTTSSRTASDACLAQHGYSSIVKYQPASRYWTFQWIESGIFVALAAILVALAVVAVRRRDA
jgi:hypothetical protein